MLQVVATEQDCYSHSGGNTIPETIWLFIIILILVMCFFFFLFFGILDVFILMG